MFGPQKWHVTLFTLLVHQILGKKMNCIKKSFTLAREIRFFSDRTS